MSEVRDDSSRVVANWSERKIVEATDAQIALGVGAVTPGLRLGHFASARALLGVLCDRLRPAKA